MLLAPRIRDTTKWHPCGDANDMQGDEQITRRRKGHEGFSGILDESIPKCGESSFDSQFADTEVLENSGTGTVYAANCEKKKEMSLEAVIKALEEQSKTFREEFSKLDRRISRFELAQEVSEAEQNPVNVMKSTQVRENSPRLAIRPKEYIEIPIFEGVKQKDFASWARGIQNKRTYYGWTDKETMDFAYSRIEGYPLEIIGAHIGEKISTLSWQQFVEELSPLFPGEPRGQDLYLEAKAYRQQTGQVSEYIREKTRLLILSCPEMPDVVRKFEIFDGLQPEIQCKVNDRIPIKNISASQLVAYAIEAETAQRSWRSARRAGKINEVIYCEKIVQKPTIMRPNELNSNKPPDKPVPFVYRCHKCGKRGHKAAECRMRALAASTNPKSFISGIVSSHGSQNTSAIYTVIVQLNDANVSAMIDCGCTGCVVTQAFADKHGLEIKPMNSIATLADCSSVQSIGSTEFSVKICNDEISLNDVQVWPKCPFEFIIMA